MIVNPIEKHSIFLAVIPIVRNYTVQQQILFYCKVSRNVWKTFFWCIKVNFSLSLRLSLLVITMCNSIRLANKQIRCTDKKDILQRGWQNLMTGKSPKGKTPRLTTRPKYVKEHFAFGNKVATVNTALLNWLATCVSSLLIRAKLCRVPIKGGTAYKAKA